MSNSITIEDIENSIVEEMFYHFPDTTVTVCLLRLNNDYCVLGQSACVDPRNFDIELGKNIARSKAMDKCWDLLGFRLADKLHGE